MALNGEGNISHFRVCDCQSNSKIFKKQRKIPYISLFSPKKSQIAPAKGKKPHRNFQSEDERSTPKNICAKFQKKQPVFKNRKKRPQNRPKSYPKLPLVEEEIP